MPQALNANPAAAPAARPMGQDCGLAAPLRGFCALSIYEDAAASSDGSERRAHAPKLPSASHRPDPFMQTNETDRQAAQAIVDFYKKKVHFSSTELQEFIETLPVTPFTYTLRSFSNWTNDVLDICNCVLNAS